MLTETRIHVRRNARLIHNAGGRASGVTSSLLNQHKRQTRHNQQHEGRDDTTHNQPPSWVRHEVIDRVNVMLVSSGDEPGTPPRDEVVAVARAVADQFDPSRRPLDQGVTGFNPAGLDAHPPPYPSYDMVVRMPREHKNR